MIRHAARTALGGFTSSSVSSRSTLAAIVCRGNSYHATVRNADARPAPDLVDRRFTADGPNQLRVADTT